MFLKLQKLIICLAKCRDTKVCLEICVENIIKFRQVFKSLKSLTMMLGDNHEFMKDVNASKAAKTSNMMRCLSVRVTLSLKLFILFFLSMGWSSGPWVFPIAYPLTRRVQVDHFPPKLKYLTGVLGFK